MTFFLLFLGRLCVLNFFIFILRDKCVPLKAGLFKQQRLVTHLHAVMTSIAEMNCGLRALRWIH